MRFYIRNVNHHDPYDKYLSGAKTGMYLVNGKIRRLHPEECRKIMGFAEGFKVHPRQNIAFQQFGNSVAVPVVRAIGDRIKSILNHSSRIAA